MGSLNQSAEGMHILGRIYQEELAALRHSVQKCSEKEK
jgi:hypothetical protein